MPQLDISIPIACSGDFTTLTWYCPSELSTRARHGVASHDPMGWLGAGALV